jgi:metallophosphoesterase (TIGR00282 family)
MQILFIGDIVGRPGRRVVRELLPGLVKEHGVDLVIANAENAAAGFGITRDTVDELLECGIHLFTTGNHVWDKKEVLGFIDEYANLLRPANFPEACPGIGHAVVKTTGGFPVAVINLAGRVFMNPADCPFRVAKTLVGELRRMTPVVIVDMHAEATSEKQAMGWYLDGEVSAVLGTHTHVQTADETVLPGGTAYITDAGMTGPHNSIIGIEKEMIIERFLTGIPCRFEVARGDVRLQGVVLSIDPQTGKAQTVRRINLRLKD